MNRFFSLRCTLLAAVAAVGMVCAGCHRDMRDQPRYEPLEASEFFPDGQSARQPLPGTVARGQLGDDEALTTGKEDGVLVAKIPVRVDEAFLRRGEERYRIYCSMCHGFAGEGDGMVVQRGFVKPPTFHQDRLRNAPNGHYFDVITHGIGRMPRYAVQVPPRDRWAITAYVRVLQQSRNATMEDVPVANRKELQEAAR